jgi:hypothetical protein
LRNALHAGCRCRRNRDNTGSGQNNGRAIAIDVGDQDNLKVDAGKLHDALTAYGITHDFEIYSGTHTRHVAVRFQEKVILFFSRSLAFT